LLGKNGILNFPVDDGFLHDNTATKDAVLKDTINLPPYTKCNDGKELSQHEWNFLEKCPTPVHQMTLYPSFYLNKTSVKQNLGSRTPMDQLA
jgi:hypothetical protein